MCPVQLFDTVSVSYNATLPSGEVIESAPETKPIILTIGSGKILKAAEASLLGMEPGQSKTVHIQPEALAATLCIHTVTLLAGVLDAAGDGTGDAGHAVVSSGSGSICRMLTGTLSGS